MSQQSSLKILVDIHPENNDESVFVKLRSMANNITLDVTLFVCDYHSAFQSNYWLHPTHRREAIEKIKDKHIEQLTHLAKAHSHTNIQFRFRAAWHHPYYEKMLSVAHEMEAQLIMKQSSKHSSFKEFFLTPNDHQLLKTSDQPILLSKSTSWEDCSCIIAAVDSSHESSNAEILNKAIVEQARFLSTVTNLPVKYCNVFDPTAWELAISSAATAGIMGQVVTIDSPEQQAKLLEQVKDEHKKKLEDFAQANQINLDQIELLEGIPEEEISQACKNNKAALVIVGTAFRTGFVGSTAEKLLELIPCDIVGIKYEGFSEQVETH